MSSNFEWRTDDDTNWEIHEEKRPSRPPRRPFWLLLLVGVIAAGGFTLYQQLSQRIETVTGDVNADILASHNLIQEAAAAGDVDVFRTLLSGADLRWTSAQSQLVDEALFFERSAFGLMPLTAGEPVAASDVALTIAPNFDAAELATVQPYAITTSDGMTMTVNLQQTAVYRRGNNRWLYAPPQDEFWGNWLTAEGKYLTIVYPQRDEEVALSLSFDLETLLGELCRQPGLACNENFHMRLRLETSPSSLRTATNFAHLLSSTPRLELPAPTLIGTPVDDMGYQALYRGYGALLVSGALAELTEYGCCRQGMLFRALVDYQLDEMGLRPYPLTSADYDTLLLQNFEPQRYLTLWALRLQDNDRWREIYSLVAFLRSQPQAPATSEMLARLVTSDISDAWFSEVTAVTPFNSNQFAADWLAFTAAQGVSAQQQPPHPLPTEPVKLNCFVAGDNQTEQYQYDFPVGIWDQQSPFTVTPAETIVPLGQAVFRASGSIPVVDRLLLTSERGDVLLWQRGDDGGPLWLAAELGPENRYVLLGNHGSMGNDGRLRELVLVDTATCAPGDCPLTPVPAIVTPAWAPDGSRTVYSFLADEEVDMSRERLADWQRLLALGSARLDDALQLAVSGRSPFWLDNARFGYVTLLDGDEMQPETAVQVASVTAPEAAVDLLRAEQLRQALPMAERPASLLIRDVVVPPGGDGFVVVTAVTNPTAQSAYVFLINLPLAGQPAAVEDIAWLADFSQVDRVEFSPNGRWLYSIHLGELILYDTDTASWRRQNTNSVYGNLTIWSPDGNWLLEYRENYLLLQSPETGYVQVVPHTLRTCYTLGW